MEIKKLTDLPIGELGAANYVVADIDGVVKRINAASLKGIPAYPLVEGSEIPANSAMRISGAAGALAITLGAPVDGYDAEYRISFVAGDSTSLSVTPPDGYTIVYPDDVPIFTDGKLYELSFAVDAGNYIVCLSKEVDLV